MSTPASFISGTCSISTRCKTHHQSPKGARLLHLRRVVHPSSITQLRPQAGPHEREAWMWVPIDTIGRLNLNHTLSESHLAADFREGKGIAIDEEHPIVDWTFPKD